MIKYYKICELIILIESSDNGLFGNYFKFECEPQKPDLSVVISRTDTIPKPIGDVIINDQILWVDNKNEQLINISLFSSDGDEVLASMDVNYTWSYANIKYLNNNNEWEWKRTNPLFEILFRNHLIFNNGIVIHASAIEWNGQAILFSAPAGTGKTTQSNLWKKYKEASVLNGDRPAIRIFQNEIFVYGTPWSGSSKDYMNRSAPLKTLVLLEQSPVNSIKKLDSLEVINKIMPRFFLPYNDKKMIELSMNTIEQILKLSLVYLLKCTPDRQAVDLLYETINEN